MFEMFKRKLAPTPTPAPALPEAKVIPAANAIADVFSAMIASGQVQEGLVYDVSALPYPKETIKNACIVTIRYSAS